VPDVGTEALRALAIALAPHLRECLAVEQREGELVDVARAVPLPRRTVYGACRRGDLVALKRGRRWLATREAVESWLRKGGPRLVAAPDDDGDLDDVRRSLMRQGPRSRSG
jgi:hypothetical protein